MAPTSRPEDGYHLTTDLINRAIGFIADHLAHQPQNPFVNYLPLGAAHAPHHAPTAHMEAVRGRYDRGWDVVRQEPYERQLELGIIPPGTKLPSSNPDVPAWDSLDRDERRVAARLQEAYAAFVEHADAELGRLVEFLRETGRLDNTIIIVTSDNGFTDISDSTRLWEESPADMAVAVQIKADRVAVTDTRAPNIVERDCHVSVGDDPSHVSLEIRKRHARGPARSRPRAGAVIGSVPS